MTIALWQPPTFLKSFGDTEIWNALVSWAGRPIPLTKSTSAEFVVEAAPDPAIRGHLLRPEHGPDFLVVPLSFPFGAMFGADIDVDAIAQLPQPLARSLDDGVISTLWGAMPDSRLGSMRIVASGALSKVAAGLDLKSMQWLRLTLTGLAAKPAVVLVVATMADFSRAAAGGAIAQRAVAATLAATLTSEGCYTLGSLMLSRRDYQALRPGDVVVLPPVHPDMTRLRAARKTFVFRRQDKAWALLGTEPGERYRPNTGLSEGTTAMQELAAGSGPDGVSIVVDFDLGSVTVPLAAIEAWQPGAVVPLEPPVATDGVEVTIRANGQVVGVGDLVRIDDRVAVRLTRLGK